MRPALVTYCMCIFAPVLKCCRTSAARTYSGGILKILLDITCRYLYLTYPLRRSDWLDDQAQRRLKMYRLYTSLSLVGMFYIIEEAYAGFDRTAQNNLAVYWGIGYPSCLSHTAVAYTNRPRLVWPIRRQSCPTEAVLLLLKYAPSITIRQASLTDPS